MEMGIGLTFGAFVVEVVLFLVAVLTVVAKPTLRTHAKLRPLLVGVMSGLALLALLFPAVLLRDTGSGEAGLAWPYYVVLLGAPLMAVLVAVLFRRER